MKKRSSKNLRINTRITLATIFGIVIPVAIVFVFSSIFLTSITSYFNFSSVSTSSYSMLNQIQWSQTVSSISNELISDQNDTEKYDKINGYVTPLEELGIKIYIERNGEAFYSTAQKKIVTDEAKSILTDNFSENINYFAENGMLIVTHANNNAEQYLVVITSTNYTVYDVSDSHSAQNFQSLVFSKTGLVILLIVLIFIMASAALSLITSHTINKPIKKLADGANEIANGNLDYTIDYDSTNEIGQTVKAFNAMSKRLKRSIEEQNRIEQSRKEMIAGVAHDLRTPLTSAKGYVEGLLDGIANTPEMQERYLKTIYSSTLAMENMLDDLLTVSRLELGSIELHCKALDINGVMDDCADELALSLEKQGFQFAYDNSAQRPSYVALDVDRFMRVVHNIVSNSVRYAKKDAPGQLTLSVADHQKSVIISISDNGIGVEPENLTRIFEPLYRADRARTRVTDGSGIGLAVCKQIIELHGGHIWATGAVGEGLTILISLDKIDPEEWEKEHE